MAKVIFTASRKLEIEDYAEWILEDYYADTHEINPFIITYDEGIPLFEKDYDSSFKAMIQFAENRFWIYVNKKDGEAYNAAEMRFSAAHELGHYFIPEHREKLMNEGILSFSDGEAVVSGDIYEKEAEFFASCLLMPRKHFLQDIEAEELSFNRVVALADKYKVSLTAILLRYMYLSRLPMMIICSRNGSKGWKTKGNGFPFWDLNLGENYEAPASTAPQLYFTQNVAVTNETRNIPADLWFKPKTEAQRLLIFREFNFLQKAAQQVMTVVWKNPG